eukprot:TRINITY_DN5981_c0_g2_i1.p1 TRINITY_DN5981_c0_g2~~TRINITY_DN5981_c0_g2_i1.p1  ORF type:complete len:253 (-),score=55.48 TRINITY_DN5981_c0_g2_i1:154-912(-)
MPAVFGPLVRRELLCWMPLDDPDLTQMPWFKTLQDYGVVRGSPMDPDDVDYNLIPRLVANTALPIACDAVEFDWDPLSRKSSKKVVRLWDELSDFLDSSSDSEMCELREIVLGRLKQALQETLLPRQGHDGPLQILFRRALKLLGITCLFTRLDAGTVIQRLALQETVEGFLVPHLQGELLAGAVQSVASKCAQIVLALPKGWRGGGLGELVPGLKTVVEEALAALSSSVTGQNEYMVLSQAYVAMTQNTAS